RGPATPGGHILGVAAPLLDGSSPDNKVDGRLSHGLRRPARPMIAILGFIVVLASVLGGFALAGGPFAVLLATSEYVVIVATSIGTMLVSTPPPVIKAAIGKSLGILKPN